MNNFLKRIISALFAFVLTFSVVGLGNYGFCLIAHAQSSTCYDVLIYESHYEIGGFAWGTPDILEFDAIICCDANMVIKWTADSDTDYCRVIIYHEDEDWFAKTYYENEILSSGRKRYDVAVNLGEYVNVGVSEEYSLHIEVISYSWENNAYYPQASDIYCTVASCQSDDYGVYYYANGGKNAPSLQMYDDPCSGRTALSNSTPIREGYIFLGWSEAEDAKVAKYQPGDSIAYNHESIQLYAVWKKAECQYCGTSFYGMDINEIMSHEEQCSTFNAVYKCSNCCHFFENESAFRVHETICNSINSNEAIVYICSYCGEKFNNQDDFKLHYSFCSHKYSDQRPENGSLVCWNCNKDFYDECEFNHHIQICPPSYPCPYCAKEFRTNEYLNAHIENCSMKPTTPNNPSELPITMYIKNNTGSKTINYGETLTLTVYVSDMPSGAGICWYIDGVKRGEGTTFKVSPESGSIEVTAKIVNCNGKVLKDSENNEISDSQTVSVNAGFWQKIVSFFKNLFGIDRTVVQVFKTEQ